MKIKFLPISWGLIIGVFLTMIMISVDVAEIAHGDGAASDSFSWSDVFDLADGMDLYLLIYKKTMEYPDKDALRDLAANYGMTTAEAQAVLDGSVTPIFNSPDRKGTVLTMEDAMIVLKDAQEDFKDIKELYDIKQEVDMAIKPSEIFANGDLSDSGFDLIHDLDTIEKILFFNETASTVGGDFVGALDSPNNATERDETFDDYVYSDTPVAIDRLALTSEKDAAAVLQIGDEEVPVEILEEDVCISDDPTKDAIDQFEEEEADRDVADDGNNGPGGGDDVNGIVGFDEDDDEDLEEEEEELQAAPAGAWGSPWCPGFPDTGSGSVNNFSKEGVGDFIDNFKSIGGSPPAPQFVGASARSDNEYIQANASVCLSVQLIRETLSSYNPGDSCIQCEIEKINKLMEKTLSHSLIPGKATGNLLESAKCKKTGSLLNIQFITIWNPIPTPANDELIFGKNIFDEWNDFANRYQPVLLQEIQFTDDDAANTGVEGASEFIRSNAPSGSSQIDILNQVQETSDSYAAKAAQQVKTYKSGDTGTNQMLYLRNVLLEMRDMNNLFKSFRDLYGKINTEAIAKIKEKPNVP